MDTAIKILLGILLVGITAPLWLYALAAMVDNALREDDYYFSGSCPDSPDCEADFTFYTHAPETSHANQD